MNFLIIDIIGLYMANFDDYLSSWLGLSYSFRMNGKLREANTIIRIVGRTWYSFFIYKFGLATVLVLLILYVFPYLKMFIYLDTVIETAVSIHNIKELYLEKKAKVR
jgi:hypothetical protein